MGKLNFRGYFILQFYPTRKMCRNLMHAMFYSIVINYRKLKAVNLIIRSCSYCSYCMLEWVYTFGLVYLHLYLQTSWRYINSVLLLLFISPESVALDKVFW